jgi:uncharacterized protein with von Willebrand factor type A (vWA) domain
MNEAGYGDLVFGVFVRLRSRRFQLGVGELRAALRLLDGGWELADSAQLREDLRLLWCRTEWERHRFAEAWNEAVSARDVSPPREEFRDETAAGDALVERAEELRRRARQPVEEPLLAASDPAWSFLPVQTSPAPAPTGEPGELNTFWPLPRRSMDYGWRYLRRMAADGPSVIPDIAATIEAVARSGVYLEPVYRRRETNHIRLMLMVDQGGSMGPFHRFTRDLVESLFQAGEAGHFNRELIEVWYFHNVIGEHLYANPHLTKPEDGEGILGRCDNETSVIIVSDAGAAKGLYRPERIRETSRSLHQLRKRTNLIAWLNPMPEDRWPGTSAQIIAHLVRMCQMTPDGFANAIDEARGLMSQT